MLTIPYTSILTNLDQTMQKVCNNHTPVIIKRPKAEPVVMLSLADYKALEETHYLLRSPTNAARLMEAIDEAETMIEKDKTK